MRAPIEGRSGPTARTRERGIARTLAGSVQYNDSYYTTIA